jgi:hypothetical protein
MDSSSQVKPSFLSRAKLISEVPQQAIHEENFISPSLNEKQPSFLSRAKKIEETYPDEAYPSDEEIQRNIERNQTQFFSRMGETVLGLPGDLANFVGGMLGYDFNLPGSKKLRELSESVTGGYTAPQSEGEERMGEFMQDIASFAIPGAKHYSIARNLGIPVLANLAKEGVKEISPESKAGDAAKIGTMVILDLLGHRKSLGSAKEYASSLFQKAEQAIPEGVSIEAGNLEKALNGLEKTFKAGGKRPSTADALEKIAEIKGEIKNGRAGLKDILAYRPSINELIDKYKGFDIGVTNPAIRAKIINNLQKVKGKVINAGEEYGKKYNPEYLKISQAANESYAAVQQSNKIANALEKYAPKLKSKGAQLLLGIGASTGLGTAAKLGGVKLAGGLLLGVPAYKLFKTIIRSKSPTLRNHYFDILKGAASGNASQISRNAKALDKALLEMDKTGEIEDYSAEEST